MPPSTKARPRAVLPVLALLASTPTVAVAQEATPVAPPAEAQAPLAAGASLELPSVPSSGRLVRISQRGLTLASGRTVFVRGRSTTVPVHVELRSGTVDGRLVAETDVAAGGRFRLQGRAGSGEQLRLVVRRTDGGSETADLEVGQVRKLRAALASWYGPGLYGNRTACGRTLTPGLKGVAHKNLPCGTQLTVKFRGRTTRATVVDRGPYAGAREFDLTKATAQAIGFRHVGRVWVGTHG